MRSAAIIAAIGASACQEYDVIERTDGDVFFQIDADALADVLFVVDDSASMAEEQGRLAANFAAFVDAVVSTDADWHLGVVTTDTSGADAGILRRGVLDPDTVDLAIEAGLALAVGAEGSRDERGFDAALLALDGRNPGFRRPEAKLNVVFVSDEDDISASSPEAFTTALAAYAGDADSAAHGVVGDLPDGCASGAGAAEAAPRYIDAIEATGGYRDSICADDYSELLARVGFDVAGLIDRFPLSKLPSAESIRVHVDGVAIPQRDVDGWTYDPGDNAIVFHGRAIPRPAMAIAVDYVPLAGG